MPHWRTYKRPDEHLDFGVDWSGVLDGDTIASSSFVLNNPDASGCTVTAGAEVGSITSVWVDGGIAGQTAEITMSIVTTAGREWIEEMLLPIIG